MVTTNSHEIDHVLDDVAAKQAGTYIDDYAEDHVRDPSELSHAIEPGAILGDSSKPFANTKQKPA